LFSIILFSGSRLDEVIEFFSIYLILPAALGRGVYPASNRNEYQEEKKKAFNLLNVHDYITLL
jgi:hypothetical protein